MDLNQNLSSSFNYKLIDSPIAFARIFGSIIGFASIFLAWVTVTTTTNVIVDTGAGAYSPGPVIVSTNMATILGNGTSGYTIGGVIFLIGVLCALITYLGWIAQLVGLIAFISSIPGKTTMSVPIYGDAEVTTSIGVGVIMAIFSMLIGLYSMARKRGWVDSVLDCN